MVVRAPQAFMSSSSADRAFVEFDKLIKEQNSKLKQAGVNVTILSTGTKNGQEGAIS